MTDVAASPTIEQECRRLAEAARAAARPLATAPGHIKDAWLHRSATALVDSTATILAANGRDVAAAVDLGLTAAAIDRLTLDVDRVAAIARSLREVAALPDPVGEIIHGGKRPNGLDVAQIRVPLGVVFMIYESRPNVTVDAAALCVKSGNAAILRGGKEAQHSNRALAEVLTAHLEPCGLPRSAVQVVSTTDRAAVGHLLALPEMIDLAIPRGGEGLIRRVVAEARMPVLKHYDGICHIYVDRSADPAMATAIILNSKASRPGVCNAVETLLIDEAIADDYLPVLGGALAAARVEIRGDERTCAVLPQARLAVAEDWDTEYLDLIVAIRVVCGIDDALAHIERHGSKHTDAIVARDYAATRRFVGEVDSAAVVVNASTRFNDGGQLGLGAEIGISTDKFHARGPCGLRELTTTKWIIRGDGQVRG